MNPHIIKLLIKGHEEKIKEQDYLAWLQGQYTLYAVSVAIEGCIAGKKAKLKYLKKPIMQNALDEIKEKKFKESNEEVAVFEMKRRIKALKMQGIPESPE